MERFTATCLTIRRKLSEEFLMEVFLLCCDIDGQQHGSFSSPYKLIDKAKELLSTQPFHLPVSEDHLYVDKYIIDTPFSEIIDYTEFLKRYDQA